MEQVPGTKSDQQVEEEIDSKCCLCRQKWTGYRGKFKCSQSRCGVPVIVCTSCDARALRDPDRLSCELCIEGYKAPEALPDLIGLKRKAETLADGIKTNDNKKAAREPMQTHTDRLFLARLPLTVTVTKIGEALGKDNIKLVHWLTDKKTGAFYGSCVVQMTSSDAAKEALEKGLCTGGIKIDKKKLKISLASVRKDEQWLPEGFVPKEFPPVGH
jgi:hypothetical protein